jgi:hypothetical protein
MCIHYQHYKITRMCVPYQHCKITRMCVHYQHCKLKNKSRNITHVDNANNVSYLWLNDPTRVYTALLLRFRDHRHTQLDTHTHTRLDSSEQVISSSQRPLPTQHTTNASDKHQCPHRNSNPQSQTSSGRRPTPWTAQPPGSARTRLSMCLTG